RNLRSHGAQGGCIHWLQDERRSRQRSGTARRPKNTAPFRPPRPPECLRDVPLDSQSRVPRKSMEVTVVVKNGRSGPDRDSGDQAIDEPSDRHSTTATGPIEVGGTLEVREAS